MKSGLRNWRSGWRDWRGDPHEETILGDVYGVPGLWFQSDRGRETPGDLQQDGDPAREDAGVPEGGDGPCVIGRPFSRRMGMCCTGALCVVPVCGNLSWIRYPGR